MLLTGATGVIGQPLARRLGAQHDLVTVSRSAPSSHGRWIQGSFDDRTVLASLGNEGIDTVIHLAAQFGSDVDACLEVNALGTLRMIQWLADRGTRRFILASSIAVVGCLSPDFQPLEVPIPDDHPSLATDAYGFSKAMMEQAAEFAVRCSPELEVVLYRIGVVLDHAPEPVEVADVAAPYAALSTVPLDLVVDAFVRAAEAPTSPGLRRMNLVADPRANLFSTDRLQRFLGAA